MRSKLAELVMKKKEKPWQELVVLAIDVGSKRMGLAIWNPRAKLTRTLAVLHRKKLAADLKILDKIIQDEAVEGVLIGLPISLSGNETASTENSRFWAELVEKEFDLPVAVFDESLSTKEAVKILRSQGKDISKKDSIAAALTLEEFMREEV